MNVEAVLKELRHFVELTRYYEVDQSSSHFLVMSGVFRTSGNESDIVAASQVVDQILDRVLPRWRTEVPASTKRRWAQRHEAAQRAIVQVERQAEIDDMLGDVGPRLTATGLHPWVWEAARSLWLSGHRREAVRNAAVKINAEMQNRLERRDISEVDLINQALSDDPASATTPRLALPTDDPTDPTAKSIRRGVRFLGVGLFSALRNPSSHKVLEELEEQEALEQLAAFSVFARFADSCRRVTH